MKYASAKYFKATVLLFTVILSLSMIFSGCNKDGDKTVTATGTGKASVTITAAKTTLKPSASISSVKTTSKNESTASSDGDDIDTGSNDDVIPWETDDIEDGGILDDDGFRPDYSYDFKGETIIVGSIVGNVTTPAEYPMSNDRSGAHIYGTDPVLDIQYNWAREAEKKFNCRIKILSLANDMYASQARFATEVLAGIHTVDIIQTAPIYCTPTFMVQGLIYPLSDYLDFDADPLLSDPVVKNSVTYAGKQWGLFFGEPATNLAMVYNLDIRDRDGLEDPLELAMKGQWTWEKCVEVLQNATHDFNGDGVIDQWGLALIGPFTANFVTANKGTVVEYKNQRFDFTALDPATIRAMTFISDLFNTYKVAKSDWFIFRDGKAFMDNLAPELASITNARMANIKNYRFVAYPAGPDNYDGKITMSATGNAVYIPITSKNPEGLAKFMAYFFQTYNNPDLIIDPKVAAENRLRLVFPNDETAVSYWIKARYDIDPGRINWGAWGTPFNGVFTWIQNQALTNLAKPGLSVRQYIDSILPQMQAELDLIARQE